MDKFFDVVIIGTGTAGYTAAYTLVQAGKTVAIIDKQAYGGTCAMRGCQPKKYFVAAAESIERVRHMENIGISGNSFIDWADLLASKEQFTGRVPDRTKRGFEEAGIETLSGNAKFISSDEIVVDGDKITAENFIIATGSKPMPLGIKGEEHICISDDFMDMDTMPEKIVFIGGGFISFEFAHIANQAGSNVTILHHNDKLLKRFEPELVSDLCKATSDAGIIVVTNFPIGSVEPDGAEYKIVSKNGKQSLKVSKVFHGAGRVADIDDLGLDVAGIEYSRKGITIDKGMQTTNSRVYAIGDCAATILLATLADMEAEVAAQNILGNMQSADYSVVPSAVFTLPPLATVGITEVEASSCGKKYRINKGDFSGWPSSRRIGQKIATYKVIIDEDTDLILGAHLLGHNAPEAINIFAMAIRFSLTTLQLKEMIWAYPTNISDLKYMI